MWLDVLGRNLERVLIFEDDIRFRVSFRSKITRVLWDLKHYQPDWELTWVGKRVVWCGVMWCGVVWCGVVWCGVVWCGVVWCGAVCARKITTPITAASMTTAPISF